MAKKQAADNGWREVADTALAFVQQHGPDPG
jgi:hypothetical protein